MTFWVKNVPFLKMMILAIAKNSEFWHSRRKSRSYLCHNVHIMEILKQNPTKEYFDDNFQGDRAKFSKNISDISLVFLFAYILKFQNIFESNSPSKNIGVFMKPNDIFIKICIFM